MGDDLEGLLGSGVGFGALRLALSEQLEREREGVRALAYEGARAWDILLELAPSSSLKKVIEMACLVSVDFGRRCSPGISSFFFLEEGY